MSNEKKMYPIIVEEFKKMGFPFPIKDEFGIRLDEYERRVDVFGCKWDTEGRNIETIGIEVKYSPNRSVNIELLEGLSQCIDYLPFFKYVGLCGREGKITEHLEKVLEVLTINRITANFEKFEISFPEKLTECKFYNKGVSENILLRSSMILSFHEIFKNKNVRDGEFRHGEGWLAVNFRNNLQMNTWYEEESKSVYLGVNIERKSSFRNLVRNLTEEKKKQLKKLFEKNGNMYLTFCKDRRAPNDTELFWREKPLSEIKNGEIDYLINKIKQILKEKQWRPHITIYVKLWNTVQNKKWHENRIKKEKKKLMKFIEFFKELV